MRKFTIFTVILTVIVVVVLSEIFVNDYLPKFRKDNVDSANMELTLPESLDISDTISANVLGSDVDYTAIPRTETGTETEAEANVEAETDPVELDSSYEEVILDVYSEEADTDFLPFSDSGVSDSYISDTEPDVTDFEDENYASFSTSVLLREDQVRSAGFSNAYLEDETHDGFLYKTVYIDDLYDVDVKKTLIKTDDTLFAKVYVFQVGPLSSVSEVYEVLKVRGAEGLDIEINETNDFGSGSFYMNDKRRAEVVFLTVKIGSYIYGFSYPKEYHPQIKNLITLLDMEF
jgi:hypothetical protein